MKAKAYGILAVVVCLILLAMPMRALAHDHDGDGWGHHEHGHHYGWYKHHGGDRGWYDGRGWRHHHDHDGDRWYGGYGDRRWGGYQNQGYYGVYPGGVVPPIAEPWSSAYPYAGSYAAGNPSLMLLRQTMSQRYNANQALYQAAMAQGNYSLANKAQARMMQESATINQADAMMNGAAPPVFPGYGQPSYAANPYAYGQTGYSPLSSIIQMLGY